MCCILGIQQRVYNGELPETAVMSIEWQNANMEPKEMSKQHKGNLCPVRSFCQGLWKTYTRVAKQRNWSTEATGAEVEE